MATTATCKCNQNNISIKRSQQINKTCPARSTRWSLDRRTAAEPAARDVIRIVNMQ